MSLPSGYEGIILTGEQAPVTNLPQAFRGVVLSFSGETIFINVKNGLGKPIVGMEVSTPYNTTTLTGFTDANGNVQILSDATGTITFKKDKTFRTRAYNRGTDGDILNYVYNIPLLE
jgi:hypothetical protein